MVQIVGGIWIEDNDDSRCRGAGVRDELVDIVNGDVPGDDAEVDGAGKLEGEGCRLLVVEECAFRERKVE